MIKNDGLKLLINWNLKEFNYEPIYREANNIICRVFTNDYKEIIMKQVLEMVSGFNQIKLDITRGYYKYIGSGSGRQVFDMENGYVIKVAKNKAGIAQNKAEYKISFDDNSDLFAKVMKISDDFKLLIMQKADKIYNILSVWTYFHVTSKRELFNSKELQNIKKRYNLLLGDFARKSSWGMINGRPVIIDYGFTREVKSKYY